MPSSAQLINEFYGKKTAANQKLAEMSYKIARDRMLQKQRVDERLQSRRISLIANGFVPLSVDRAMETGDFSQLERTESISERNRKAQSARNKEFSDWLFSGNAPTSSLPYRDQEQAIMRAGYGDVPAAWKHLQSLAKADQMKRLSARLGQIAQKPQADVANILALTQLQSQLDYTKSKAERTAKDKRKSSRDAQKEAESISARLEELLLDEEGRLKGDDYSVANRELAQRGNPVDFRIQAFADSLAADEAEGQIPGLMSRADQVRALIAQFSKSGNQAEALQLLPLILDTQYDDEIESRYQDWDEE